LSVFLQAAFVRRSLVISSLQTDGDASSAGEARCHLAGMLSSCRCSAERTRDVALRHYWLLEYNTRPKQVWRLEARSLYLATTHRQLASTTPWPHTRLSDCAGTGWIAINFG
jgi:hypothetical protein